MQPRASLLVVVVCGGALVTAAVGGELVVSSDFENGSAEVVGLDQASGTIRVRPAGDPQRGWPCWWSFKVDGIEPGQTLHVEIDRTAAPLPPDTGNPRSEGKPLSPAWSQPDRASYSVDGGHTWLHTEPGASLAGRMRYSVTIAAGSAWFAWGPVFSVADAAALVDRLAASNGFVQTFELARTRQGRAVAAAIVRAGRAPDNERYGLWIQARQHAWESGGSWVGRGFIEWLVGDDPRAVALREKALVYYVPLMDVDSVATGNGGKGQHPQDHNRDWSDKPHFPEVAAAQRTIAAMSAAGHFDLFVDLHNPGAGDKQPFFFVAPEDTLSELGRSNLSRFFAAAQAEIVGPLAIHPRLRPSGAAYSPRWREISKNWVMAATQPHVVALTLETAWNTPHSTTAGYQTVGRQLGLAIERYLRHSPRVPAAGASQ